MSWASIWKPGSISNVATTSSKLSIRDTKLASICFCMALVIKRARSFASASISCAYELIADCKIAVVRSPRFARGAA